ARIRGGGGRGRAPLLVRFAIPFSPMNPLESLSEQNLDFVEELHAWFLEDPGSVPASWRAIFESADGGRPARTSFTPSSIFRPREGAAVTIDTGAATIRMARV